MTKGDGTHIGGGGEAFGTTHWSEILDARTHTPQRRREVVGAIAGQYWKPVYAYLRRRGNDNEQAKDLTQGFFEAIVLGRELIQQADRSKGRFRALLLTALDRYVTSVHRSASAQKRRPAGGLVQLGGLDAPEELAVSAEATPEEAFAHAWASHLLEAVLSAVEAACRRAGQATHWEVFRRTVVEPILSGGRAPPLAQVCAEMGIDGEQRASNMNVTVKRRFRSLLVASVRPSVDSDEDVDDEIRELMAILSRRRPAT